MATKLTAAERRDLLELYVELSSLEPEEHMAPHPYSIPLIDTEISGLKKLLASALVGAEPSPEQAEIARLRKALEFYANEDERNGWGGVAKGALASDTKG